MKYADRRKLKRAKYLRLRSYLVVGMLFFSCHAYGAATFTIVNLDGPGEGYNSTAAPDPISASGGNSGNTLGEQRLIALQNALDWWGVRLDSDVPIIVDAQMNPQDCTDEQAVLASAATIGIIRDFTGAPESGTWYHQALANRLAGLDLLSETNDIGTTANSAIDNNDDCLAGINWFYGLGPAPGGTISFFNVMIHEIGHGVGVSSFTSTSTGAFFSGFPGIYDRFIEDHDNPLNMPNVPISWLNMANQQRMDSMTDDGNLHWTGQNVVDQIGVLDEGDDNGNVRLYAPCILEEPDPTCMIAPGSSISHWDVTLQSNIMDSDGDRYHELMEPFATGNELALLTDEMLQDLGWNSFEGDCGSPLTTDQDTINLNGIVTADQDACVDIITTGNTQIPNGESVIFDAGHSIVFGNGFSVALGATLNASVNPLKSLRH